MNRIKLKKYNSKFLWKITKVDVRQKMLALDMPIKYVDVCGGWGWLYEENIEEYFIVF